MTNPINPPADGASDPVPAKDRSRRGKSHSGRSGSSSVRADIIDAAVESILDLGFYRASTNEIARRAGVAWSSIHYYFGTREALLLAAVADLNDRFTASIESTTIDGGTLQERLRSLYDHLAVYFGDPVYLVLIQIVLNLQHDPNTSSEAVRTLAEQAETNANRMQELIGRTIGSPVSPAATAAIFHTIRGVALSQQLTKSATFHAGPPVSQADASREIDIVIAGLAQAVGDGGADPSWV
jgi:AcrR family transcriptional regulator